MADYLAKVQDHIKTNLMTRYGAAMLSDIKFQYVLTVPAVWSDVAKDATVTAAKHAGMGPNMTVISGTYDMTNANCEVMLTFNTCQNPRLQHTSF